VVEHRVEESGAGRFMKHDPDIQQHDGEGTNLDRSCRSARLCLSLCTVTVKLNVVSLGSFSQVHFNEVCVAEGVVGGSPFVSVATLSISPTMCGVA